jgi:hypothetical protein
VGKSERRELANRMAVLLAHLLKGQRQPRRRGRSWEATIRHQRERILRRLARTPSLKTSLADPDWWLDAWGDACLSVAEETGIGFDALPSDCPWTADQILDQGSWPETPRPATWRPTSDRPSAARLGCPRHRSLNLHRNSDRHETAGRVGVILAALVDHPKISVGPRVSAGNHGIPAPLHSSG